MRRVAVIGAGWAGLSAAVSATRAGLSVDLFEMAPQAGGRARSTDDAVGRIDNGQHILIGAYLETLALMRLVGADPDRLLRRTPLALTYPDGAGLVLPKGHAALAFASSVLRTIHWPWSNRMALLARALRWRLAGFQCSSQSTVADLCHGLPQTVIEDLVEPLCVAALNTAMAKASGQVFLRVLRDALFAGAGAADLLLPAAPLSALLPEPALQWLTDRGAQTHWRHRVQALETDGQGWQVDGNRFDAVVLACTARESARLVQPHSPGWSQTATDLACEPIVTVWLRTPALRWAHPMTALRCGSAYPAQFAFDLGSLNGTHEAYAFVVSGAAPWLTLGLDATAQAVVSQARDAFPGHFTSTNCLMAVRAERRATFACTPELQRPPCLIAKGLVAAGDFVDGPFPATLEGAVRSGRLAVEALQRQ